MWSWWRGKFVSFEHRINFTRVQDVSIRRSSSAVIQTWSFGGEAHHIHQQHQTSNLDCGLYIKPSRLPLLDSPPSPSPPWVTSYPLHSTSNPSLFPFHALIYSLHHLPFIIRCITPHYAISRHLMTPTDTPTIFNKSRLISFVLKLKQIYGSKRPVP